MTLAQIVSAFIDIGFGASALLLAARLTARSTVHEARLDGHEVRIVVLEKKAA